MAKQTTGKKYCDCPDFLERPWRPICSPVAVAVAVAVAVVVGTRHTLEGVAEDPMPSEVVVVFQE